MQFPHLADLVPFEGSDNIAVYFLEMSKIWSPSSTGGTCHCRAGTITDQLSCPLDSLDTMLRKHVQHARPSPSSVRSKSAAVMRHVSLLWFARSPVFHSEDEAFPQMYDSFQEVSDTFHPPPPKKRVCATQFNWCHLGSKTNVQPDVREFQRPKISNSERRTSFEFHPGPMAEVIPSPPWEHPRSPLDVQTLRSHQRATGTFPRLPICH